MDSSLSAFADLALLFLPLSDLQLNAIQDGRPPVSRAKMGSITKLAMKSHKVRGA